MNLLARFMDLFSAPEKNVPVDADTFPSTDSVDSNKVKRITWANIKATLETYFDGLYQAILISGTNIKTVNSNSLLGSGDLIISASPSYTTLLPMIDPQINLSSVGSSIVDSAGDKARLWRTAINNNGDGANVLFGAYGWRLFKSADSGATLTEVQPAGNNDKNWKALAIDDDGSVMVAGVYGGRLYKSTDSGSNWSEMQPAGNADKNWQAVAVDADGSVMIAVVYGGRVYLSTDSGANWAEKQPMGNLDKNWLSCCSDSDGSVLGVVGDNVSGAYISTDSAANWVQRQTPYFSSIACDSDGSVIVAGQKSNGYLHVSTNSGVTLTAYTTGSFYGSDFSVACDSDGSVIIGSYGGAGKIIMSTNSGSSFAELTPKGATTVGWLSVGSDSDGSVIITTITNDVSYYSTNSGSSWTSITDSYQEMSSQTRMSITSQRLRYVTAYLRGHVSAGTGTFQLYNHTDGVNINTVTTTATSETALGALSNSGTASLMGKDVTIRVKNSIPGSTCYIDDGGMMDCDVQPQNSTLVQDTIMSNSNLAGGFITNIKLAILRRDNGDTLTCQLKHNVQLGTLTMGATGTTSINIGNSFGTAEANSVITRTPAYAIPTPQTNYSNALLASVSAISGSYVIGMAIEYKAATL